MKRVVLAAALVLATLLATAWPFLPGRFDGLALHLSVLGRGVAVGSILLVPLGLPWLVREAILPAREVRPRRTGFAHAIVGLGSLSALVAAVFALGLSGIALATIVLSGWVLALCCGAPRLVVWARGPRERDLVAPALLVIAPLAVLGAQLGLAEPLESWAWNRTMDGMAPLIADMERYRGMRGSYPRSLFAEWADYRPEVVGVSGYLYEPAGDGYRLAIEVPSFSFDSRVFLSYDPTDRHVMASHDADLLARPELELPRYHGYHTAGPLDRPHWKALHFD